jgi:hypothetical protein
MGEADFVSHSIDFNSISDAVLHALSNSISCIDIARILAETITYE